MNLTLNNLSDKQLVAMGDGLAARGQWGLAAGMYRAALKCAPPAMHGQIHLRIGFTSAPGPRSPALMGVLEALEPTLSDIFVGDGLATWLKTPPFLEDQRFMDLVERHRTLLPVANWHWNLQTALWAVQQALQVEGDLVELGVFRGHTTLFVSEYLQFATLPRKWLLYDTFDGIPDDQIDEGWATNGIYKGTFSYEEVRDRFAHIPNIDVIKGRVPEILEGNSPDRIAFIHIDLNNATAEIQALDALFDRVTKGGVILLDDYCWAVSRAQRVAESAWFEARGVRVLALPTGQGLVIKP